MNERSSSLPSFHISNEKTRRELGWQPRYHTFSECLPEELQALTADRSEAKRA